MARVDSTAVWHVSGGPASISLVSDACLITWLDIRFLSASASSGASLRPRYDSLRLVSAASRQLVLINLIWVPLNYKTMSADRLGRFDVETFALRRVSVVPLKCPGLGGWEIKNGAFYVRMFPSWKRCLIWSLMKRCTSNNAAAGAQSACMHAW
jgi:hypothetical protein